MITILIKSLKLSDIFRWSFNIEPLMSPLDFLDVELVILTNVERNNYMTHYAVMEKAIVFPQKVTGHAMTDQDGISMLQALFRLHFTRLRNIRHAVTNPSSAFVVPFLAKWIRDPSHHISSLSHLHRCFFSR